MRVDKYRIKYTDITEDGATINIPIKMSFQSIGQTEVVEREFVSDAIEESINPIVDYEKVRFKPIDSNGEQIYSIKYAINLLDGDAFPNTTTYAHAKFIDDDIKFSKNSFKRSFLRLSFYDSDIPTNQNLVSFMTLFTRLTINDFTPIKDENGNPIAGGGLPKNSGEIPIRFIVSDPIKYPGGISEGYHIYHFKDDVTYETPKVLYMRSTWNNAKTGESVQLITDSQPQSIDNLVSKLHVRYILKRGSGGYWYEIDENYSNNITFTSDGKTLQLYQIQAI